MQDHKGQVFPYALPSLLTFSGLRAVAAACFIFYAFGCMHQPVERTSAPTKSPAMEKQASPGARQPSRLEQPDKARTVEKKSKEKKSAASTDTMPGKKLEQEEESSADTLVPPPPLKPPTFGGAGG